MMKYFKDRKRDEKDVFEILKNIFKKGKTKWGDIEGNILIWIVDSNDPWRLAQEGYDLLSLKDKYLLDLCLHENIIV